VEKPGHKASDHRKEKEMKITDERVIKMLKGVRSYYLEESVAEYPENERDGRTDLEFFADELSYHVSCYMEDGHVWKEDLDESRRKLRETKNGKVIPLSKRTLTPLEGYYPSDIQIARDTINEFNRLLRLLKKLQKMGVYGYWYTA